MNEDDLVLTLFTNNVDLARRADEAGIDRVGLDLETIGKAERQAGLKTWISDHQFSQIDSIRNVLRNAKLFVRTNPIHSALDQEIDKYVDAGVNVLMLPMFYTANDAHQFAQFVNGRAEVSLLAETPGSVMRLHEIVKVPGISEIHVGLNDLHLAMQLKGHFEVLVSDILDGIAKIVREAGIAFGFGGVGRVNDKRLPIPADLIYAQYPRLGASRALVSRVFVSSNADEIDMTREVKQLRERMKYWNAQSQDALNQAREQLRHLVSTRYGLGPDGTSKYERLEP